MLRALGPYVSTGSTFNMRSPLNTPRSSSPGLSRDEAGPTASFRAVEAGLLQQAVSLLGPFVDQCRHLGRVVLQRRVDIGGRQLIGEPRLDLVPGRQHRLDVELNVL